MSRSTLQAPTFQSGEAYTPRYELWMNGIIWQSIFNVVNSFTMQEMQTTPVPNVGLISGTKAPIDIFIQRVRILQDTVLSIEKEDEFYKKDMEEAESVREKEEQAHLVYRAILKLLHRRGHLRFKPPRDFADD